MQPARVKYFTRQKFSSYLDRLFRLRLSGSASPLLMPYSLLVLFSLSLSIPTLLFNWTCETALSSKTEFQNNWEKQTWWIVTHKSIKWILIVFPLLARVLLSVTGRMAVVGVSRWKVPKRCLRFYPWNVKPAQLGRVLQQQQRAVQIIKDKHCPVRKVFNELQNGLLLWLLVDHPGEEVPHRLMPPSALH